MGCWGWCGLRPASATSACKVMPLIAMILGILFTTGLASLLMALVFHSSRSRKDDEF